jgi:hypothetical protein
VKHPGLSTGPCEPATPGNAATAKASTQLRLGRGLGRLRLRGRVLNATGVQLVRSDVNPSSGNSPFSGSARQLAFGNKRGPVPRLPVRTLTESRQNRCRKPIECHAGSSNTGTAQSLQEYAKPAPQIGPTGAARAPIGAPILITAASVTRSAIPSRCNSRCCPAGRGCRGGGSCSAAGSRSCTGTPGRCCEKDSHCCSSFLHAAFFW